jgi:hypothetical protein
LRKRDARIPYPAGVDVKPTSRIAAVDRSGSTPPFALAGPKIQEARISVVLIDTLSGRDRPAGIREGNERRSGFLGLSLS